MALPLEERTHPRTALENRASLRSKPVVKIAESPRAWSSVWTPDSAVWTDVLRIELFYIAWIFVAGCNLQLQGYISCRSPSPPTIVSLSIYLPQLMAEWVNMPSKQFNVLRTLHRFRHETSIWNIVL